ncbi:MAG: hypothetical protein EA417_07865 [Gammaproteobacteria bacterium]|nr:MAG: hypothetical protein EA417_07865 [Gammaproteobacteria bacterium]
MFIARVSRGRTIRQFVSGTLLLPTRFVFVWLAVYGGTALQLLDRFAPGIQGSRGVVRTRGRRLTRASKHVSLGGAGSWLTRRIHVPIRSGAGRRLQAFASCARSGRGAGRRG